jgi:hypothetical protein
MQEDLDQLVRTFTVLEEACATMYEFVMHEKEKLDDLTRRMESLEKKLDNK